MDTSETTLTTTPERRALYDDILRLRDEIGQIDFDVVEAIRELRSE